MSEQKDGQVTYTGNILDIQTIRRGKTNFELTEMRMDIGQDKNSTIIFEAKKDDPLITGDVYDKVHVRLWVNFREWKEKIFCGCTLAEMTVLERADKGVSSEAVEKSVDETENRIDGDPLPF